MADEKLKGNGQPAFETFIQQERERLTLRREEVQTKRKDLDDELAAIERELLAIAAYENVKRGKLTQPSPAQGVTASRKRRGPRAETGGRRQQVLDCIKGFPDGATAEVINQELGASEKSEKQSIANALVALKKDGLIKQNGRRTPYTIAVPVPPEAPSPP